MTGETSELISKASETNVRHRRKEIPSPVLSPSKNLSPRRSIIQWFTSYFTFKSPDNKNKKQSTLHSCLCNHLCCKLFLFLCTMYLIMYLRPDYSIHIRNSLENMLTKYNLTSEEFQLRPGQRLAQYRQPSMPIIIIPGIISTGLELWQGTECTAGKFRHRFWTSMQMVDNIGRDHQCWLRHISLNLSTWYEKSIYSYLNYDYLYIGKIPKSIRLRPVLGWAAADYVYVLKIFPRTLIYYFFGIVRFPGYWLWSKVIHNLADIGYDPNNLVTLGYDWRLAPQMLEERDGYFTQLKFYTEFLR